MRSIGKERDRREEEDGMRRIRAEDRYEDKEKRGRGRGLE